VIIKVSSAGDVTVDDYDLFTGFHVEADGDGAADRLAATMGEGTRAENGYLWIAERAIRHWVGVRADDDWEAGFTAMVDYARSKGWTDPAGTHLRAHIEHRA
jgi:hypothetical protein